MLPVKLKIAGLICGLTLAIILCSITQAQDSEIISDIEKLADSEEGATLEQLEALHDRIQENSEEVIAELIPRLGDTLLESRALSIYVWALGITKDTSAVDHIIRLADRTASQIVGIGCMEALAGIGDAKSGDYILSAIDEVSDPSVSFELFNLLAQMQYEPALPSTIDILKRDPKQFYWQPIFVFGKMGDKAVPFLLEHIDNEDGNIRGNAINVLGQWLIPVEASKLLRDQFWKEDDFELKGLILSSVEMVTADRAESEAFFNSVIKKESNEQLTSFAKESLVSFKMMDQVIDSLLKIRKTSADDFQKSYDEIYNSAGKEGDYEILMLSSTHINEPELRKLRRRILDRNSDEAFYDYQRINRIIILNRMLKNTRP